MKLNAAIADYDQSESSPTPNCEENKTQIKNWERFCNKFTYNSMRPYIVVVNGWLAW